MSKRRDINVVVIQGRLTRKPEGKVNQHTEKTECWFNLAVNDGEYTPNGSNEPKEIVYFLPFKTFGVSADNLVKYCDKGRMLTIEGKLKSYSKGEGENKQTVVYVECSKINYDAAPKNGSNQSNDNAGSGSDESGDFYPAEGEDDLPF